ncbi:CMRF35-like molecule 8 [Colossoma macropomum]|uniref:CMRF35-like molecule 8 n=1 Tax=Colossoma macropomum TaxID=42526 RepID=UPI001863B6B8|nr:CMRF35-like molecule 8 [Colossoma macropomum]
MTIIWIIIFIVTPAGISAVITVSGYLGESVQIKCPYDSGYETNIKYLCKGECSLWKTKDIPVRSGSAEDQRFSLDDDTAARVFTINITDLRPEDGGTYWCGTKRTKPLPDLYTEILLLVKTVRAQSTHLITFPSTGIIILYVFVSLLVSGIALGVLVLLCKWRKFQVTLADVQSSITAQRNARRDWDIPDHEYDVPGNQHSMTMSPVYESLNPNTNQSDSVYQRPPFNTNQSDSIYQKYFTTMQMADPDTILCN